MLESIPKDETSLLWTTKAHYWIDVLFELPIVFGVLITGFLLSWQHWPLSTLHWIKLTFALIGISFNLDCCRRVILRFQHREDLTKVKRYSRFIKLSTIGIPFGLVAAYIGLVYFT